jgi:hypothetical protein
LTLFHPASGQVRVKGVASAPNAVLHPWLEGELAAILAALAAPTSEGVALGGVSAPNRAAYDHWQADLTVRFTLPDTLPPLRLLLVLDNLSGHKTPSFVLWLVAHGIMPLYTPLSGSWLNRAESIQRVLVYRALAGQQPTSPEQVMQWLEDTAAGWNAAPTPFIWGGQRALRRARSRQRHHALAGSGACTRRPLRRRQTTLDQWRRSCQVTH